MFLFTIHSVLLRTAERKSVQCSVTFLRPSIEYGMTAYKLRRSGILGNLRHLLGDYLRDRHQRVVLSRVQSDTVSILAGAPQGLILG